MKERKSMKKGKDERTLFLPFFFFPVIHYLEQKENKTRKQKKERRKERKERRERRKKNEGELKECESCKLWRITDEGEEEAVVSIGQEKRGE